MPLLTTTTVIDGKPVKKCNFTMGEYDVYRSSDINADDVLYFVDKFGNVVGQIELVCDMSQGSGYISDISGRSF